MSNTGIPKVNVAVGASSDEQPEVDISDEEFLQFDTSAVPVIITLTKVAQVHSLFVSADITYFLYLVAIFGCRLGGIILWMQLQKRNPK